MVSVRITRVFTFGMRKCALAFHQVDLLLSGLRQYKLSFITVEFEVLGQRPLVAVACKYSRQFEKYNKF